MTPQQREVTNKIAAAAVQSERRTGLPAALTAAQCILESAWLKSAPGNNCFGIKYRPRHVGKQSLMTTEYVNGVKQRIPQDFAVFETLADCFADHAKLITEGKPYEAAWQAYQKDGDLQRLVFGIAPKYATDPGYANKVMRLINSQDLQAAIQQSRNAG